MDNSNVEKIYLPGNQFTAASTLTQPLDIVHNALRSSIACSYTKNEHKKIALARRLFPPTKDQQ